MPSKHHLHYYFESTINEVVKAHEYINDYISFVEDIEDFCLNQINEDIIRNYNSVQFEELLYSYVDKYNDEVRRLLSLKIIVEFLYRHYYTKNYPSIHHCLVKAEVLINRNLGKYIYIETKEDKERKTKHFGNMLAWQIVDVYQAPTIDEQIEKTEYDSKPINQFEKINWLSNERLIPYLFDALARHNFISIKNNFTNISNHFSVNGKEITRENIKSNYSSSGYRDKVDKSKTIEMIKIDEIVDKIKELNTILSNL